MTIRKSIAISNAIIRNANASLLEEKNKNREIIAAIKKYPGNSIVITQKNGGYDANSSTKYMDVLGSLLKEPQPIIGAKTEKDAIEKYLKRAEKMNIPIINVISYIDGNIKHKKLKNLSWEK